ncbi:hypothetical protein ACG9HX_16865, partial [Acinetobacter ursingii]|uniref:hypothetical protein n=1 Tax=Acinetobacter ursingii TaxID=108980 RepID=UPI003AF4358C
MANWTLRTYTDARKALKVSQKLIVKWSMESGARKPEDQEKRRAAAKARHAQRQPAAKSQYSQTSWFGTPDLPLSRDLW